MGFSKDVRIQALVNSARHCCVCHRYRGVKIEVHHLVQEADGGPNTYENAIPLCFDCHSDAGHYNDWHPKGTKFSISELRQARENWYDFVEKNPVTEKLIISDHIHTNYYILHSFDVLKSLISGDYGAIKKCRNNIYFLDNQISKNWRLLLGSHKDDYGNDIDQRIIVEVRHFDSIEQYEETYDDAVIIDKSGTSYPYYHASRKASWNDLRRILSPNQFLNQIEKSGIPAESFCTSILYKNDNECGDGIPDFDYTEYIEIAPISYVLLGITNASKDQIKLNRLCTKDGQNISLPNFNLLPYELLLIPIATVINANQIDRFGIILESDFEERVTDYSRIIEPKWFSKENLFYFNESVEPHAIIYNTNDGEYEVTVHELDFNNLYSINSSLQCGSCPHLFFEKYNKIQEYYREILTACSFKNGSDSIIVPAGAINAIIRELEEEITYIDSIQINDQTICKDVVLKKGDSIKFKVQPNDIILIQGRYEPTYSSVSKLNDLWYRNQLIKNSNLFHNSKQNLFSIKV